MNAMKPMKNDEEQKLREFLKNNLARADAELSRDLWPQTLERLGERVRQTPWFDWALLAMVVVCLLLFPKAIPMLLYHV
jgi:hypothetical protein